MEVEEWRGLRRTEHLGEQRVVDAARKHGAASAQHDNANGAIATDIVECDHELLHRRGVECVALVGPIEPQSRDRSGTFELDACHAANVHRFKIAAYEDEAARSSAMRQALALSVFALFACDPVSWHPPTHTTALATTPPSVALPPVAAVPAPPPRTRATLDTLLERHDALVASAGDAKEIAKLRQDIDRVALQRDAYASRLFWYTDLGEAKAEAQRTGKPILSLRLLGKLDEELSCANSRLFRIVLYANPQISQFLRDTYVLHWSSERPVPQITLDFGDGRVVQRTITGNSVHYVLDSQGRMVDALPGLYGPAARRDQAGSRRVHVDERLSSIRRCS
jgi:hypothetical protein